MEEPSPAYVEFLSPAGHETTIHDIHDTIRYLALPIQTVMEIRMNRQWVMKLWGTLSPRQYSELTRLKKTMGGKIIEVELK